MASHGIFRISDKDRFRVRIGFCDLKSAMETRLELEFEEADLKGEGFLDVGVKLALEAVQLF